MLLGQNRSNISYLGLPKKMSSCGNKISSYNDLFSALLSACIINSEILSKIVCLDVSEFVFLPSFFDSVMEEEDIELSDKIDKINTIINKHSMRIFIYVGKDYFLGTQIEDVKIKTIALLDSLSILLDSLGIDYPSLIVRIGSAYGNRKKTMKTFCSRLPLLNKNTVKKLTVTNDDKPSLFSITDLLSGIYYECSIPLCFRLLPHHFNNGGLTIREALFLACSTWDIKDKPIFFHSESFEIDEYGISLSPVNADLLTRRIPTFGLDCDVIIDSQLKEIAYMHYIKNHRGFLPMVINKKIKK